MEALLFETPVPSKPTVKRHQSDATHRYVYTALWDSTRTAGLTKPVVASSDNVEMYDAVLNCITKIHSRFLLKEHIQNRIWKPRRIWGRVKVVPVLCYVHRSWGMWWSGGRAQGILMSSLAESDWSASRPVLLYPRRNYTLYPLSRKLRGQQSQSGCFE
jgi:hypothetical protein